MATPRVAVAVSGGRDSTALLHCTVRTAAAPRFEEVLAPLTGFANVMRGKNVSNPDFTTEG